MYINFEDERILPLKAEEMNSIIEAYFELYPENIEMDIYLFFDEIQNIDRWELFIRRLHDTKKFKIFVTGSSSKLLSKDIATSLRGRTITYNMYPLDFNEFLDFKDIKITKYFEYEKIRYKVRKMFEIYLYDGGFPEVDIEKEELKQKILINYFEMFIYKDLVE
ncbi:MAG: AAA family ATPase [DPANN group archaeon]|nr:AAA family ATPase [DPANN group archaeon]